MEFLANPARCSDQLLRWHFRQAVLANMRGTGEIILEHDFPPGSDMMGEILGAPQAEERMEFELFGRLAAHTWKHVLSLNFSIVGARLLELTTCIYETRILTSGCDS